MRPALRTMSNMSTASPCRNLSWLPSIPTSIRTNSGCPGRTRWKRPSRPRTVMRSGNCNGGFWRHTWRYMTAPKEASKLGQFSWALFDWANQPFFTIITTFIFAPYFANVLVGDPVKGQSAWAFTQSTSGILIALMSPSRGDGRRRGRRKLYIFAFQLLLAAVCRPVVGLSRPARSHHADQLGGDCGHGRRRDVDRVQQRAASQHRAAPAHGLAERVRLGPRLLRRPHLAVHRAGGFDAVDVRTRHRRSAAVRPRCQDTRTRTAGGSGFGPVARDLRAADVPVHARFWREHGGSHFGSRPSKAARPWCRRCASSATSATRSLI